MGKHFLNSRSAGIFSFTSDEFFLETLFGFYFLTTFVRYIIFKLMSLQKQIMEQLKTAMKAKDTVALESLRAVKSAILLAQTESGAKEELSAEKELKIVQKLVKQRKDSATLFAEQGREDLAAPELAQAAVIAQFLPEQMSEEALKEVISEIISQVGAAGMKDMGKVMGMASKKLAGKADGKAISNVVKSLLA